MGCYSVSWKGGQDCLSWHFERNDVYSVKSGYRLALNEKLKVLVSNSLMIRKWWNFLWSLHLPPKIELFVLRVCLNAIPSMANLWKRKMVAHPRYDRCGSELETTGHVLFWCGEAKKVWGASRFDSFFDSLCEIPTIEVFLCLFSRMKLPFFVSPLGLFGEIATLLSEETKVRIPSSWLLRKSLSRSILMSPFAKILYVGLGVAIRDDKGKVILASSNTTWLSSFTAEVGEFIALREGLLLVKFYNIPVQIVEVNASNVASILNSSETFFR
ncbi:hypothetical protein Ddye_016569 [Dipteronia dyeriana]|uniref:Reverse transcriptase zinc-binding domain-containing protein n=1 Tax=Dipteronia dyeriana TaxID=168575 RepID=A0AAD9X0K7_9ROSI|nr:hypothetical protein Ddye_016569 [Dipteronia dyeriana]